MKKLKILIPLLIVVAVIAGVVYYLISNNTLALTNRGKVGKGLAKTFEKLDVTDSVLEENDEYKYLKNLGSKPFEEEITVTADVDIENLEDIIGDKDTAKKIQEIIDEVTNSELTAKLALDKEEKEMVFSIAAKADDIFGELTGEAVVTEDEIAFRSKEISEDFLKITRDDAEDNEELKEAFDLIEEFFDRDFSKMVLTKEEINHFKETYLGVLDEFVTEDVITSEKGEVTVDGKKVSCDVTTTKLDNEKVKELLKKYVETYKNDKEGKKIIEEKFTNIYGEELATEMLNEMDESLEDIEDAIDEIENTSIEFVTYGTMTEVYKNVYKFIVDEEEASISQTFNGDSTEYVVEVEEEEVFSATVKNVKGGIEITTELDIEGETADVTILITKERIAFTVGFDEYGTFEISADIDVKKNTDKEFSQNVVLKIDVNLDIDDTKVVGTASLDMDETIKIVDSIDVPDTDDAISITDNKKLEKYAKDAQENAQKILEKIEKSKTYKIIEELSASTKSSYNYSYDDYDFDDYDFGDYNF